MYLTPSMQLSEDPVRFATWRSKFPQPEMDSASAIAMIRMIFPLS